LQNFYKVYFAERSTSDIPQITRFPHSAKYTFPNTHANRLCMWRCVWFAAELLVDKAMELKYVGGVYGGNVKPAPFLCLILKMLQIQPEKDIIVEFISQPDFKCVHFIFAYHEF